MCLTLLSEGCVFVISSTFMALSASLKLETVFVSLFIECLIFRNGFSVSLFTKIIGCIFHSALFTGSCFNSVLIHFATSGIVHMYFVFYRFVSCFR